MVPFRSVPFPVLSLPRYVHKFISRGLTQTLVLAKKGAMKIERKKDKKTTGALYKLSQRSERGRQSLNQGLMDHFIIGNIDSV